MGAAYGVASYSANGLGQGDLATLFPALALVSGQFNMINQLLPQVRMGSIIDDRNFRGTLSDIEKTFEIAFAYDRAAGHLANGWKQRDPDARKH